jgi:macrodomain Ter protein organizer (MatP/YcbG family)
MAEKTKIFENGSAWVKADFHLHTAKDPLGIKYEENPNEFFNSFLAKLEEQKIKVGVIANHNKFYLDEFKELKKKALQREIFLLPGIELNVADGKNGIHVLIVFDYEAWVDNRKKSNKIETFIRQVFGKKQNKPAETISGNLLDIIDRGEDSKRQFKETVTSAAA